jgi:hypothetical protein
VFAEIANSCGSVSGSVPSSPMITDVSITPRCRAQSGTRGGILGGVAVKIGAPAIGVDRCCCAEGRERSVAINESPAPGWRQSTDRHAVAAHGKTLARIERTHDLTALVAQFTLS